MHVGPLVAGAVTFEDVILLRGLSRVGSRAAATVTLLGLMAACISAPPSEEEGPPAEGIVWTANLETGDLGQFKDTPWNVARGGEPPQVVTDPVRDGGHALAFTIPADPSSEEGACCDPRSELEPDIPDLQPGDELYFAFSTRLSEDFPVEEGWQVVTQWKADADGSPPLSLVVEDGEYRLAGGDGHPDGVQPFSQPLAPAVPGDWADWMVHITFSPDPAVGFVEVWQGEQLVLPRFQPETGTLYPSDGSDEEIESFLKFGYYRDSDISQAGTIYFDQWRIGTSRESVA